MNHLNYIYLDQNAFTGNLPSVLFEKKNLIAFVASINCFSGSLPETICLNPSLIELVIDGAHASNQCSRLIANLQPLKQFYSTKKGLIGSIPSCLFDLPRLTILHLSGNNLQGTLPDKLQINRTLLSLILSSNQLQGNIPYSIWTHSFSYLDLSFNRFSGEVYATSNLTKVISIQKVILLPTQTTINVSDTFSRVGSGDYNMTLQVNRLSGNLPLSFVNVTQINILEGNMFGCNYFTRKNLPKHDPAYESYQCGSDFTNTSLYIWLILLSLLLLTYSLIYLWRSRNSRREVMKNQFLLLQRKFMEWSKLIASSSSSSLLYHTLINTTETKLSIIEIQFPSLFVCQKINIIYLQFVVGIIGYIIVVMSPIYILLGCYYSMFSHVYIWIISSIYLTGEIPAIILLSFYILMVILVLFMIQYIQQQHQQLLLVTKNRPFDEQTKREDIIMNAQNKDDLYHNNNNNNNNRKFFQQGCKVFVVLLINALIIITVNMAYVYSINEQYNRVISIFITLAISLFKFLYSNYLMIGNGRRQLEQLLQIT
jgi:uncharacterized membrane protein affecting hemolysin expression